MIMKVKKVKDAELKTIARNSRKQSTNTINKISKTKLKEKSVQKTDTPNIDIENKQEKIELTPQILAKIAKKKLKKKTQKLKKKQIKCGTKNSLISVANSDSHIKQKLKTCNTKEIARICQDQQLPTITENKDVMKSKSLQTNVKINKKEEKLSLDNKKEIETKKRDPEIDASTVFVGNLPTNTKRVQLARLFSSFGVVKSIRFRSASGKILFKHKQRKEAGSLNAYVVLESSAAVHRALELNGSQFKMHNLRVTKASIKQSDLLKENKRTIFVGNLKYSADEQKLREIFSSCGEIDYIRCLQNDRKGCKGVAYVCFKTSDAVSLALELDKTMLDERPIHVERYIIKKLGARDARVAAGVVLKRNAIKNKTRIDAQIVKKHIDKTDKQSASQKKEFRGIRTQKKKKK